MDQSPLAWLPGPPPSSSIPIDWDAVESWLGLRLPSSYKELASTYGPLDIGDFIWMHTPCVDDRYPFNYSTWLRDTHRLCRINSRDVPPHEPPPFHPAPGGLLAWGMTRSITYLFWDTGASDDPDQWSVVAFHQDAARREVDPWQRYDLALPDMLSNAVRVGLPLPGGDRLGPLPAVARRTAFLVRAQPWKPPTPRPEVVPESLRHAALVEGSGLDVLCTLVPPPEVPYLGDGTWEQLFDELGTRLPTEYVDLMNRYGSGCWSDYLTFVTPLRGYVDYVTKVLDGYRDLRADYPELQPLAVWPEPAGILPFAHTIDSDVLGWLTDGDPDEWPLIVYPRDAEQSPPPIPGNLTDVLLTWLRGHEVTDGLPGLDQDDDPLDFITFTPWNDNMSR